MNALVTGGAGFIGSTLVDLLLAEGHRVDAVDNLSTGSLDNLQLALNSAQFHFTQCDVRSEDFADLVRVRQPEVIFHLAAQASVAVSMSEPLLDADVNVTGSLNVLQSAHHAGIRKVVFAASGGTLYGEVPDAELPADEGHPWQPMSVYGVSKMAVLAYAKALREVHGPEFSALALANVYGPRQNPHGEAGVIAIFTDSFERDRSPRIFGDGEQTRDFVFVSDVARAFALAATTPTDLVLNIGTGIETSVNEIVATLAAVTGKALPPEHEAARSGEVRRSALDSRRAQTQLGWCATTSLQAGIEAVVSSLSQRVLA